MIALAWAALAVCFTLAMMLYERHRSSTGVDRSNPVHYGPSSVSDHEYENLPHSSSGPVESDSDQLSDGRP